MRDFTKKYFHLNSSAVYNSSAKNEMFSYTLLLHFIIFVSYTILFFYFMCKNFFYTLLFLLNMEE